MVGWRLLDAIQNLARPSHVAGDKGVVWMPLAEAAERLRAIQRGSDLDCISRGLSGSDADLVAFWARRVAEAGVAVYGSRVMASRPEAIPVETMRRGKLLNQASRLDPGLGQPIQDFCALHVKTSDFESCLARLRPSMAA